MSRSARAVNGAVSGVIQYGVQLASQVFVVPFVLATAGQATFGAYVALVQFVGYLGFIDFGFGSACAWYLARAFGRTDGGREFRSLMYDIRLVYSAINAVSFGVLIIAALNVGPILSLAGAVGSQARQGLLVMAFWVLMKTPIVTLSFGLRPTQQLSAANCSGMFGNAARLICLVVMLKCGAGLFGLVCATLAGDLVTTSLQALLFLRRFPHLSPSGSLRLGRVREMFAFGFYALLANSGAFLISGTDSLVVNNLFGPVTAAVYYSSYLPAQALWQIIYRVPSSVAPAISELFGRGDGAAIRRNYYRVLRYGVLLSVPLAITLLMSHRYLIGAWVGEENYAGQIMTISLSVVVLLSAPNAICGTFLTCVGEIRIVSFWVLSEGIVNLVLSLALGRLVGPEGVALGTAISALLHLPIYLATVNRKLGTSMGETYHLTLRPLFAPLLVALLLPLCLIFSIRGVTSAGVSCAVFLFGWVLVGASRSMTEEERRSAMHWLRLTGRTCKVAA